MCLTENKCHLLAICINCHLLKCHECICFCTILVKPKFIIMSNLNGKYILIFTLILLTVFNCKSQNLITNGGFENISPPANWNAWFGEFVTASQNPMHRVLLDWDEFNSADLFTTACTHTWSSVPVNVQGYCQPKNGSNYTGFMLFANGQNNDSKEYLYQHLSSPLQIGHIYCLSFFVSRADRNEFSVENIGAYFSTNVQSTGTMGYINKIPQVFNQNGFIADTIVWTEIQGCFTANGGEQYITIGNFNSDANTNFIFSGTNNPIQSNPGYSYYYIDDVSLIDQTTVGVYKLKENNDFEVYPNPNTGLLKFSNLQYSNGDYNVKILDLFGKEIINEVLKEELDISHFDKGVYTLLLYKNKQLVVTKKVMKD